MHVDKLKSKYKKVKLGATPIGLTCSPGRGATTSGGDGGQKGWEVCDSQEVPLQHFSGAISNKMFGDMKIVTLHCVLTDTILKMFLFNTKGKHQGTIKCSRQNLQNGLWSL